MVKKIHLFLLFCCFILPLFGDSALMDLRDRDFSTGTASLQGEWDFYWNHLLAPGDSFPASSFADVPGSWSKSGPYTEKGYGTYRIKLLLPESEKNLALFIPPSTNRYRIYLDGEIKGDHGDIGLEPVPYIHREGPLLIPLSQSGSLDIIYQNANFDDINGGILDAPRIGRYSLMKKQRERASMFEAFLFGALLITGMLYISFYINKRDDRSSLFFGLFSVVMALRSIIYGEHLLQQVLIELPFEIEAFLGHLTLYLSVPLFLKFITLAFPLKRLKKINLTVSLIAGAFILLAMVTRHQFYIRFMVIYQLIAAATGVFIITSLILTAIKGNPSAQVTLIGFLVLLGAAINDILFSQEIIHTLHIVPIGTAVFIMSQAALLSWNIGKAFTQSEELALELQSANNSFRRFVPEEFLKYLKKERIADVRLGDHVELEMTVLFCDIRDFTTLSENMTPRQNFLFLNSFLERIGPVIRENRGFVDKYIGDGVMALFPGDADSAVLAAMEIEKALKIYNGHRKQSGYDPIRIGIGINTGRLMLGTVGENERMDSTVISDAVNVCSRIESITKEYGLSIAVSENTYNRLTHKEELEIRNIGKLKLKGKNKPISVYELFNGDDPALKGRKKELSSQFEEAVEMFERKEYKNALAGFTRILEIFPEDETSQRYQRKISRQLNSSA